MAQANLISNINPGIIRWCCNEVSISLEELAASLKIKQPKLEQGELSFNQLEKVADYFGYGRLFFLNPDVPQKEQVHSVAFRSLANQGIKFDRNIKQIVEQVESHRDLYLSLLEDLKETHELQLPQLAGAIPDKAKAVRRWLGLDIRQPDSFDAYRKLMEDKGILVFRSMGYNGKWKVTNDSLVGFSIYHDTAPVVFLTKTSPQRQTFTLFHELGHLLLHKGALIDNEDNLRHDHSVLQEREANEFAAACLIPEELIQSGLLENKTPKDYDEALRPLAKRLGISVEVIVVELVKRRFIPRQNYNDYVRVKRDAYRMDSENDPNAETRVIPRSYRHKEPVHIFGRPYVATILDALHGNQITLSKASDYLDRLKINDIKKIEDWCAKPD